MATLLLTLRGTPFLYEGQEIGMTNVQWNDLEKYDEINTKAQYKMALQEGFSHEQAMAFVNRFSRDNSRTPMQWNADANAGFTTGKPWLSVNDNYVEINVAAQESDPNSVLNFYRRLIALRSSNADLDGGPFTALLPEHEQMMAYRRGDGTVVLVNLGETEVEYDGRLVENRKLLIGNYEGPFESSGVTRVLRPLEAVIYGM